MSILTRKKFYEQTLNNQINDKNASILVCGGGLFDKSILESLGCSDVVISNLDERDSAELFLPYKWDFQDAQDLNYDDNAFDYVIIHAAIHHTPMPHKTLTELYRVARDSVLIFESRDSLLIRALVQIGVTEEYETAAVYFSDFKYGGVNNTEIPNYVYRWTEREVLKTLNSYSPEFTHKVNFYYSTAIPAILERPNEDLKIKIIKSTFYFLKPFIFAFTKLFKKQQNLFCINIKKAESISNIKPWLKCNNEGKYEFNADWAKNNFKD
jgi:ubiquinone/menaquinone biosynthesis C-methylase UbiE